MARRHAPATTTPAVHIGRFSRLLDDEHWLGRIMLAAGLPHSRAYKFHIFRKSVASHAEAAGGNATELLGHSARSVTLRYIDRRIAPERHASDYLFSIR